MRFALPILLIPGWLFAPAAAAAPGVYQPPAAFVREAFGGNAPAPKTLWIDDALAREIGAILGHPPDGRRLRYWRRGARTAWVLDEIGKERPITVGIVVDAGRIERVQVLAFRESRGWEVRHPFFTDQFRAATLTGKHELDRDIDGISGATLSVRALTRLARLALFLDARVNAS
ncbi:MAG TPA: FMN-binding protein [Acidiferrobacterales bacterium]